jgi:hypothetical protein
VLWMRKRNVGAAWERLKEGPPACFYHGGYAYRGGYGYHRGYGYGPYGYGGAATVGAAAIGAAVAAPGRQKSGPTRTSGPGDSGTFCPANLWQARPLTTSRSAASATVYSASTMAWCASRMRCRARARNLARRNRCLSRWEARRPGRRPELRRGVQREGHPRGPSLGPQARPSHTAAPPRVQIVSPKSCDQELYERQQ